MDRKVYAIVKGSLTVSGNQVSKDDLSDIEVSFGTDAKCADVVYDKDLALEPVVNSDTNDPVQTIQWQSEVAIRIDEGNSAEDIFLSLECEFDNLPEGISIVSETEVEEVEIIDSK